MKNTDPGALQCSISKLFSAICASVRYCMLILHCSFAAGVFWVTLRELCTDDTLVWSQTWHTHCWWMLLFLTVNNPSKFTTFISRLLIIYSLLTDSPFIFICPIKDEADLEAVEPYINQSILLPYARHVGGTECHHDIHSVPHQAHAYCAQDWWVEISKL